MTHELTLNQHIEDDMKRKKSIALKEIVQEESENNSEEEESELEMALLARRFRKFIRRNRSFPKKKVVGRGELEKEKKKKKKKNMLYVMNVRNQDIIDQIILYLRKHSRRRKRKSWQLGAIVENLQLKMNNKKEPTYVL